jgi:hypothetical protein
MIDWQTLLVASVLFAASLYVGRRGWLRIRSLMISKPMQSPACGGCSGCGRQIIRK